MIRPFEQFVRQTGFIQSWLTMARPQDYLAGLKNCFSAGLSIPGRHMHFDCRLSTSKTWTTSFPLNGEQ